MRWLHRHILYRPYSTEISHTLERLSKSLTKNKFKTEISVGKLSNGKHSENEKKCAAAVLIPLCLTDGKLSLLYTVRSKNLSKHRGEVSFPGGNRDKNDATLVYTALRETYEEIGIKEDRVKVIGQLNPLQSMKGNYVMPFVGFINNFNFSDLKLNQSEVDQVFLRFVSDLSHKGIYGVTQFRTFGDFILPVYRGEPKIWGLTAMMTHLTLSAMLTREEYPLRLKMLKFRS
ncbi:mitochondrial coenzyme A diphosphatase NUDT8-like [Artemia franciscana]|uniref:Nudix hydrolase domain-containing protein n=1 Tax=Artemia franciscana TaxID=6661 RepID=A0AA88L1S6_ARTSF|nr:hypothetical protein QYM36_016797 [Artemia franciscana]